MAFLRKRASGNYALAWKWKGKPYIKGLGTKVLAEAEQIERDAVDQIARIRSGDSALASKLLADGHSIVDVLFGSEEIGHLIASPADDNPLTLSQLKEAFIDNLKATSRTPGHIDGTRGHLDHFIRVLGDVRVMSLTDADMTAFQNQRGKEATAKKTAGKKKVATKKSRKKANPPSNRLISQGTIRSDFKSLRSAVNWATSRKPPLLAECPFTIPKITATTVKPFLPTEEIKRLLGSAGEDEQDELLARWLLDLNEINGLIKMTAKKMPEMLLPMQLICSTGMRRVQLVRLKPSDYVKGRLTIRSKKGAREKGLAEISLTIELRDSVAKAVREHVRKLPKRCRVMFPISDSQNRVRGPAPQRGEHNDEVLREILGYAPEQIRELLEAGVLSTHEEDDPGD